MSYILNDPAIFGIEYLNPFYIHYLSTDVFAKDYLPIRWATSKGLATKYFTQEAVEYGSLEALKYLHEKGVP